ncbi:MAG: hypothetical protein R3Y11_03300 [Pseudomonadota bacterium]
MSVSTIGTNSNVYQAGGANSVGLGTGSSSATNSDLQGVSNSTVSPNMANSTFALTMAAPTMDAASIMLALSSIQKENTDEAMEAIGTAIEAQRDEIQKLNEKRAEEMVAYFDNLAKSAQPEKTGLFGAIVKFFQAVVTAIKEPEKAKEAFEDLGALLKNSIKEIAKDVLAVAAMVASVALAIATFGAAAPLAGVVLAAVIVGCVATTASMIMSDPAIVSMAIEGKSDEEKASIMKALTITSFVCLGLSILSSVVAACCGNPSGLADNITKLKIAATAISSASNAYGGIVNIDNAVDTKEATDAKATALEYAASADETLANIAEIEKELEIKIEVLKELLASQQKMVESTATMLMNACEGNKTAATV